MALVIDDFNGDQQVSSQLESVQTNGTILPKTTNQRLNSLGGTRKLLVEGLAGSKNIKTRVVVEGGKLSHSQDSGAIGISHIIWDGDSKESSVSDKLGTYNIIADGSTKIILEVLSFDAPADSEVNLEFKIYNGLKTFVSLQKNLRKAIMPSQLIEFALKDFESREDSIGSFSFTKVSAIELKIDGLDQDIDLQFASVKTDSCPLLPNINNLVVDACGVCDGNNNSCRDCRGVINGSAKKDRCGVCNGDGQSCLGCNLSNQSILLGQLDAGVKEQEKLIKLIANRIIKLKNTVQLEKYLSAQKKIASDLQIRSWTIVWQLPINSSTCTNQIFCNYQSVENLILEYQNNTRQLKTITENLILRFKKLSTIESPEAKSWTRRNELLFQQNISLLAKVPNRQSVCS